MSCLTEQRSVKPVCCRHLCFEHICWASRFDPLLTCRVFLSQVLGNAKGAVAVVVSILLFKNPVSVMGMVGYTITVFGVIGYSEAKRRYK